MRFAFLGKGGLGKTTVTVQDNPILRVSNEAHARSSSQR